MCGNNIMLSHKTDRRNTTWAFRSCGGFIKHQTSNVKTKHHASNRTTFLGLPCHFASGRGILSLISQYDTYWHIMRNLPILRLPDVRKSYFDLISKKDSYGVLASAALRVAPYARCPRQSHRTPIHLLRALEA